MASFIWAILLLLVALLAVTLRKQYAALPSTEIKRRAERGDELARTAYRAVAYGDSLQALLWLVIAFATAGSFVLFARVAPPWLGLFAIAIVLALAFSWLPNTRAGSLSARLTALFTPVIVWLLNYLHAPLERGATPVRRHYRAGEHTGLYEPEDFMKLFDRQSVQADNRVMNDELDRVRRALAFSKLQVGAIQTPRKKVRTVSPDESLTPVLASELHESGHPAFPVYEKISRSVVGILPMAALNDIAHVKKGGTVADVMETHVAHLHEGDSLPEALDALYQTKQTLFVVINNFEEFVGIVTVHDLLWALAGEAAQTGFAAHEDRAAVAHKHDKPVEPEVEEAEGVAPDPDAPELEVVSIDDEPVVPEELKDVSKTDDSVVE